MPSTQLQTTTEFEYFLNRLSEEDLRLLNCMVVERIKLFHKARDLKNLAKFNLMDRVYFVHEGKQIVGMVTRLNRRSVTIKTQDGHQWNVHPSFYPALDDWVKIGSIRGMEPIVLAKECLGPGASGCFWYDRF